MEKPNVDIKTYSFSQPNVDGYNIGWKNPMLTYKHAVFSQPNVDDGYKIG
jgi:hypothetical protein